MKKEILIPILLLILGLMFIIINIIVYFSKGNKLFISKKLKLGALILSLTSIFSCGSPPKPACYELPPSKEYIDSMANVRKQDSIKDAEKQKLIDDSIANVNEQQEKDSLAKIKHKKKPPTIMHPCYMPPKKTCYAPVKINKDS